MTKFNALCKQILDESFVDDIRSWNYKRLASRSQDKAMDALDKAHEYDFADPERFKHEDEFSKHMSALREREKRSKELSMKVPSGINPKLAKEYWNTLEKVKDGDISPKQWERFALRCLQKLWVQTNRDKS